MARSRSSWSERDRQHGWQREIEIHEVFHKIGERAHAALEFCKLKVCNKRGGGGEGSKTTS